MSTPPVHMVDDVAGAASWIFGNEDVTIALTRSGGQMAPVTFRRSSDHPVRPYYVAPWSTAPRVVSEEERMLHLMRGDVLCFPFGFPSDDGEHAFPLHGEIASADWRFAGAARDGAVSSFRFDVHLQQPAGVVQKVVGLVDGHDVIYQRHTITGVEGEFPLGHHPMLAVPPDHRSVLIGRSGRGGWTWPEPFGSPDEPAYAAIAASRTFAALEHVPTVFGDDAELDAFPDRQGFTDAVMWGDEACDGGLAWNTATFTGENYVWFALKDPRALPLTVMFMGNGGRHYPPWNGVERILSLQDLCGYFGTGVVRSRASSPVRDAGFATTAEFAGEPRIFSHVQGIVPVPARFGRVTDIDFVSGGMTLIDDSGARVAVPVCHEFALGADLEGDRSP